jgi:hypothetical protein
MTRCKRGRERKQGGAAALLPLPFRSYGEVIARVYPEAISFVKGMIAG